MTPMPWIKSKTSQLDDPRIMRLSERAQAHYFKLYLLAGKCDAEGSFVMNEQRLTDEEIAFLIRTDIKHLKTSWKELKSNKLIHVNGRGPAITDFAHEQVSQAKRQEAWKERQERHRTVTRDKEDITRDKDVSHAPRVRVQNRGRIEVEKSKKRKDLPTPTPPQKDDESVQAGRQDPDAVSLRDLVKNKKQWTRLETAMKILKSSGLRNPKLKTISVLLATRTFKTNEDLVTYILAALASSFADPTAQDKASVAAYRLEHDQVPAQYKDRTSWTVIPREILAAANIKPPEESNKWEIKR